MEQSLTLIIWIDAWLPTLQQYTDLLYGTSPNPTFDAAVIAQLCANTQSVCTGANQQYDSVDGCVGTLSKKPYGSWNEVWGDNVVCRTLHVLLAKLRPEVGAVSSWKFCLDPNNDNKRPTVHMLDQQVEASVST